MVSSSEFWADMLKIMAEELKWDAARQKQEYKDTAIFLTTMGLAKEKAVQADTE